jgi:hypothetical protein
MAARLKQLACFLWPKNGIFRQILKYGFTEKGRKYSEKKSKKF